MCSSYIIRQWIMCIVVESILFFKPNWRLEAGNLYIFQWLTIIAFKPCLPIVLSVALNIKLTFKNMGSNCNLMLLMFVGYCVKEFTRLNSSSHYSLKKAPLLSLSFRWQNRGAEKFPGSCTMLADSWVHICNLFKYWLFLEISTTDLCLAKTIEKLQK